MKKIISLVLTLVLVLCCFVGCGQQEEEEEQVSYEGQTLLIYCPQSRTEFGDYLAAEAKEALGIDIEFLKADGATCRDKILEEKNNPQADVVMGLTQIMMEPLIAADCLTAYTASWAQDMDPMYIGTDGYYTMYWQTPILIVYNPEYITGDMIPTSWEDLADSKYSGLFKFGKLTSSTTNIYVSALLSKYADEDGNVSEEGWNIMKAIFANKGEIGSIDYNDFVSGKYPIALDWYPNPEVMSETYGFDYEIVIPEDGNPMVSEGVAIVKGTKNEELAKAFIEWIGQPEVMKGLCEQYGAIPASEEVIALVNEDLAAQATKFPAETIQDIDWELVGNHYQDWMTEIALW